MTEFEAEKCPLCQSDDYECLVWMDDMTPDYNGPKVCQECGEEWV